MRLLIDTQIFIWSVIDSERLTRDARKIMLDAETIFVSAASIWEIAIKTKIGKLEGNPIEFVSAISKSGFSDLPILANHAAEVYKLPLHHRDPFDRMLIAQSVSEKIPILTSDRMLSQYSELVISV